MRNSFQFTHLIDSALVFGTGSGPRSRFRWFSERRWGLGWDCRTYRINIDIVETPDLAIRAKIMLGFAVVLAISAASMGIAYLGFERVAAGVTSYRNSVSEADLARNIDRELISYRALARYFMVTGKEDDGKAALAAEASLKDAIDQSMKGTADPARRDQIAQLAKEFGAFSGIFAGILKAKQESALIAQNQLCAQMSLHKLDDLASAAEAELPASNSQTGARPVSGHKGAGQHLRHQWRLCDCDQRIGPSEFHPERTARDTDERRKDKVHHQGDRFAIRGLPQCPRQAR
jgi:CHASE3 domain sensor protein